MPARMAVINLAFGIFIHAIGIIIATWPAKAIAQAVEHAANAAFGQIAHFAARRTAPACGVAFAAWLGGFFRRLAAIIPTAGNRNNGGGASILMHGLI